MSAISLRYLGYSDPDDFYYDNDATLVWLSASPQPTDTEIAAAELPATQGLAKQAAEVERNRRIDLISGNNPDQWRPHIRNTAAAVDLTLRVALGSSTPDDDAALVALKSDMDAVEALETAYAALLAESDACTTVEQVEAIDVTADGKWI